MSALTERGGVFWVVRGGRAIDVRAFDLDGGLLEAGFAWRSPDGSRVSANAIAVDDDKRLWIADREAGRVLVFHVFGAATHELRSERGPLDDHAASIGRPSALAVRGSTDDLELVIGSSGHRRHAVQVFGPGGELVRSLRPDGEPHGRFRSVCGVAIDGDRVLAAERTGRVHVWRRREFLFGFDARRATARTADDVRSIAALPGGGIAVAFAGPAGLVAFDAAGRPERTLAPGVPCGTRDDVVLDDPVALAAARTDDGAVLGVLDRGGARLVVLDLDGVCRGEALALA